MENNDSSKEDKQYSYNQKDNESSKPSVINLKKRTEGIWLQTNWLKFYTYIILPALIITGVIFEISLAVNNISYKLYLIKIILLIISVFAFIYTYWPNAVGYYLNIVFIILLRYFVKILYYMADTPFYNFIIPIIFISVIAYLNIIYLFNRRFIFFTHKHTEDDLLWIYKENIIYSEAYISTTPIYQLLFPKDTWTNYYIYIIIPAFIAFEIEYIFMFFIEGHYIVNIGFGAVVILFYTICTLIFFDMHSKLAYYFNVFLLIVQSFIILDFICNIKIIGNIYTGLIFGIMWFVMNFIYFHKRKFEFFDEPY